MKVAIVSCSPFIDYVRARTLRSGFSDIEGVETVVIKNEQTGFGRYWEVYKKIRSAKRTEKPDVYVLTFRGYEMLLATLLVAGKKPVVFDEFVNPIEWLIYENHKLRPNSITGSLFGFMYRHLVKRSAIILADTKAHAEYSATLNKLSLNKYYSIPVGTDEKLFYPIKRPVKKTTAKSKFRVFYYGQNMTPLQGLPYLLEAAIRLADNKTIEFVIAGGNLSTEEAIDDARAEGAHIKYIKWVDFKKLPAQMHKADLCLGGPFGSTVQSKLVVTNKTTQAMACARPVIVGRTKVRGIFEDEFNCLVVQQGSSLSLANKIEWASKYRKVLKSIAVNGHKTYQEKLSQEVIKKDCQKILNKLAKA